MSFTLQPLVKEDAPRCVDIYFAAFQNSLSIGAWPRVPSVREWWEQMVYDELNEPASHWLKAVAKDGGDIIAFAKWQQPKPGVTPSTDLPEWPKEGDAKLLDEAFGDWARKHAALMGDRGHWYLELVATDPAHQGKGAGSQLMHWGLVQADEQGVEAYLEASPEAVALYEKLGFREVEHTDTFIDNERVKRTWYRNLFMIRPVQLKP